jgi:hypothetical protein
MSSTPPGWYHDPWQRAPMRWWDGARWTEHVADWTGTAPTATRTAVTPSVAASYGAEQRLTPWLRRLLVLWPLATAVSAAGLAASAPQLIDALQDGSTANDTSGWWYLVQLAGAFSIALQVVRILWLYRTATTANELGLHVRRTPIWSALGWIIPIVNFWFPYQGVTDLFPEYHRPDRRIAWWWASSIVAALVPLAALAAPYVPVGVAVAIVVAAVAPTVVAAVLELGLVQDADARHAELVAGR